MSKKKRKEKRMKKAGAWKGFFFILPSLCGLILFYLLPYLDVIKRSFSSPVTGIFTGLDNYWLVFGNKAFQLAVKNTVRFIITCVPILVISSLLVAVILQKIVKGNLLKIGFLFPMAIPVASVVLLWKGVFDPQGFLNSFLNLFGISGNDWMNTKSAFWVLVFSYVWKNMGYCMILWLASLAAIPKEMYEAAKIDGASAIQTFFKITVPLLKPTILLTAIMSTNGTLQLFDESINLTDGGPANASISMSHYIYNLCFKYVPNFGYAAAMSFFILLLVAVLAFIQMRVGDKRD
mgnify:FL=1